MVSLNNCVKYLAMLLLLILTVISNDKEASDNFEVFSVSDEAVLAASDNEGVTSYYSQTSMEPCILGMTPVSPNCSVCRQCTTFTDPVTGQTYEYCYYLLCCWPYPVKCIEIPILDYYSF